MTREREGADAESKCEVKMDRPDEVTSEAQDVRIDPFLRERRPSSPFDETKTFGKYEAMALSPVPFTMKSMTPAGLELSRRRREYRVSEKARATERGFAASKETIVRSGSVRLAKEGNTVALKRGTFSC